MIIILGIRHKISLKFAIIVKGIMVFKMKAIPDYGPLKFAINIQVFLTQCKLILRYLLLLNCL